jgi:hypothetical protein
VSPAAKKDEERKDEEKKDKGGGVSSDFVTPQEMQITAVSGRDELSEEERKALIANIEAGVADQSSLGGTGGTTVVGGAGPAPTTTAPPTP